MKKKLYSLLFLGCWHLIAAQQNNITTTTTTQERPTQELQTLKKSLNFLLMGDFGRYGQFYQKDVAKQMAKAATAVDVDFVISVGDNFYPNGVQSTQDHSWLASFENIYTDYSLQNNWYVVLGNHDYRGNPQAQIDYTKISRRWQMPASYFSKTFDLTGGDKVLVIFMDTSPFIDSYYEKGNMMYDNLTAQDTVAQKKWILKELAHTDAAVKWKIVVGHHPLYTGGKRKESSDTKSFENKFATIFDKYKVDAYFCGHEHDLQVIKPTGRYTTQFLSGAACEVRPTGKREGTLFAAGTTGFMTFSINDSNLLTQVVDADGKILYTTTIKK